MNPLAVLKRALWKITIDSGKRFPNKPGAVIESINDKDREILSNLKSSDIDGSPSNEKIGEQELGIFSGFSWFYQNKEFKKELEEFDKKLKK
jgi:hypothetical protein